MKITPFSIMLLWLICAILGIVIYFLKYPPDLITFIFLPVAAITDTVTTFYDKDKDMYWF